MSVNVSELSIPKILTTAILSVFFCFAVADINLFMGKYNWLESTHSIGALTMIGSLMICGIFFKGKNNQQTTFWLAIIMTLYVIAYFALASMITSPYVGVWLDTVLGVVSWCIFACRLPIELYMAKTLGKHGIFPNHMMKVITNSGTTNFYLIILYMWGISTALDIIVLTLSLTVYGVANDIPWDGSFYTHMLDNGAYMLFSDVKVTIYDFRELMQDILGFIFTVVMISHVIRDNKMPDEIGFRGNTLPAV